MKAALTINLTFHGIGDPGRPLEPGEGDVWVTHDRFLSLLDAVVDRQDVLITFDDGNASDIELALPALRERGLTATFFVVAGRLGVPRFLDADEVRELQGAGMEIGCHGMRHRPWRRLNDRALREELVSARAIVEDVIGRPVAQAACPFGSYDRRVLRTLRESGYTRVYTCDRGTSRAGEFVQARNSVRAHDDANLLEQIESLEASRLHAQYRRAVVAVKRWR